MENPNVFISYSHDNGEHKAWVLKLATDLRSHGVNVVLDQWDLRLGSDLRFFMEHGLSDANLVLCICSENYVQKVNGGTGGSGYEGMIMTQPLLSNANANYIIPVVRNNPSEQRVPLALGGKLYIDFSDDAQYITQYQALIERIYGEDAKKKPPLGINPFAQEEQTQQALVSDAQPAFSSHIWNRITTTDKKLLDEMHDCFRQASYVLTKYNFAAAFYQKDIAPLFNHADRADDPFHSFLDDDLETLRQELLLPLRECVSVFRQYLYWNDGANGNLCVSHMWLYHHGQIECPITANLISEFQDELDLLNCAGETLWKAYTSFVRQSRLRIENDLS